MKIVTCASYTYSGSSATTDYLSEFENSCCPGEYEFRFLFDPHGIRDLEYNLIENPDRHKSAHAIKEYLRYAKYVNGDRFLRRGYRHFVGDLFMDCTEEFIDNITELETEAWWCYDILEKGRVYNYLNGFIRRLSGRITNSYGMSLPKLCHERAYFSSVDRETFYRYTREYISKFMKGLNKENKEYLIVDQLLPPSSLSSYMNYFDDIKVIVTDRDPRDVFLYEKVKLHSGLIPAKSAEEFCKWYRITRKHRKTEKYERERVLLLQFEDWIYKYDETAAKVNEFIGIDPAKHTAPKTRMDPAISIKNTNLVKRYPNYQKEIDIIERLLSEYLYDFPEG